jgi:hypothetical protein
MSRVPAKFAALCLITALHACTIDELGACDVGFVETRPYPHEDPSILLCKTCDDECSSAGEPCGTFGDACDLSGEPGVCDTCCDGFTGELRCHPREH